MRGCGFFLHIIVAGFTVLIEYTPRAFRLCGDAEFMRITLGSPWAQTASDAAGFNYVSLSTVGSTPGRR
jgi:hypothetical protein